jgi:hypothetical protein
MAESKSDEFSFVASVYSEISEKFSPSRTNRLAGISERGHHLGRSKVSRKDATQT